jgi:hypothetical protein
MQRDFVRERASSLLCAVSDIAVKPLSQAIFEQRVGDNNFAGGDGVTASPGDSPTNRRKPLRGMVFAASLLSLGYE